MPVARISHDLEIYYVVDDYTDPWRNPDTILLLHGNAESGAVWFGWVPHLARHFRVVRPDMRGFGASTPMPRDFPWTLDLIIDDFICLMDRLGAQRFHLVGAKIGGIIARAFAARQRERVLTLTVVGTPPPFREDATTETAARIQECEKYGVEEAARRSMAGRLGNAFPAQGVDWWSKLMGRTAHSTRIGFIEKVSYVDIRADLPKIACPTLVITTEGSALGSVEQTRAWQRTIPNSTLLVIPEDSYHVAASHADRCAQAAFNFISQSGVA